MQMNTTATNHGSETMSANERTCRICCTTYLDTPADTPDEDLACWGECEWWALDLERERDAMVIDTATIRQNVGR